MLSDNQAAYRERRGTMDHIVVVNYLVNRGDEGERERADCSCGPEGGF